MSLPRSAFISKGKHRGCSHFPVGHSCVDSCTASNSTMGPPRQSPVILQTVARAIRNLRFSTTSPF